MQTPPTYGKLLVAAGIALAVFGSAIQSMNPVVAYYLLAASTSVNAVAAYLGWSQTPSPSTP